MKYLVTIIAVIVGSLSISGKTAIVMAHYGTAVDEARSATTDAINARMAAAFPGECVTATYISKPAIERMASRGEPCETLPEALSRLAGEGVDTVVVQPTAVVPGQVYDIIKKDVAAAAGLFKSVTTGVPLLYGVDDCHQVADVLLKRHSDRDMKHHVVFVGHGTKSLYTALYSQFDCMLRAGGQPNFHVATLKGYPDQQSVIKVVRQAKARNVTLVPLLFEAGLYAHNNIEVDWVKAFEAADVPVDTWIEGLGEIEDIQDIYITRVKELLGRGK